MKRAIRLATIIVALPLLGACDKPPQPPDKNAPPEPQVRGAPHEPAQARIARAKQVPSPIDAYHPATARGA